eukprot:TRINITY_DN24472_c0_g1_i1.p1 TRINITY_DN24472_c0_g1~~TRINITY_DN24472_c0_g1_i1.p1  ORF type:complete len:176 (-),score=44.26 TRINITY_DN24472_c0_g1_i1:84-611(-)
MSLTEQNRFGEEIKGMTTAMLVIRDIASNLRAIPMQIAKVDDQQNLWFYTYITSPKIADIEKDNRVGITLQQGERYATISGRAEVTQDKGKLEQYWNETMRPWFPDGVNTAGIALINIKTESGEFWSYSGPTSKITYLWNAAVAVVQGERIDDGKAGTHLKVELNAPSVSDSKTT